MGGGERGRGLTDLCGSQRNAAERWIDTADAAEFGNMRSLPQLLMESDRFFSLLDSNQPVWVCGLVVVGVCLQV